MAALSKAKLGGIGLPSWFSKSLEDVYREKYGGRYPGLAENVAAGVGTGLKAIGLPKHIAETTGRNITSLAEDWTPVGALTAVEEYGPVGALAAVPLVGGKGKQLVKGLAKAVEERLPNVEKTASAVVDPVAPAGLGVTNLGAVRQERKTAEIKSKIKDVVANFEGDALKRGADYHKTGKLPVAVGTRMIPPRGSGDTAPWEVTGHYVDPNNPDRYGYHLKDPVTGDTRIEIANDPRLGVKDKFIGWKPMGIGGVVDPLAPKGLGTPAVWKKHPISKIKTTVPVESMHAEYEHFGTMEPEKQISWEDLEGHNIVPLLGDPTIAGKRLLGLGGKRFEQGVDLYGGPNFPRIGGNWANTAGAASKMGKDVAGLGGPTSGVYMKMSEHSGDYAAHMAQTVHQQFKQARAGIDSKAIKAFDEAMRSDWIKKKKGGFEFPATQDWPGMENLTDEWIMSHPNDRKKMVKMMNQKPYQDAGFPDVGYARWATTEPDLLNAETYSSGHSVIQFDPEGKVLRNTGRHPTYPDEPVGTYSGRLPEVPLRVLHKEYLESGGTRGAPIPNQYLYKFLQTRPPIIKLTGERLDRVMNYLRSQEGMKLGLAGAVTAGIISQSEADDINQGAAG